MIVGCNLKPKVDSRSGFNDEHYNKRGGIGQPKILQLYRLFTTFKIINYKKPTPCI